MPSAGLAIRPKGKRGAGRPLSGLASALRDRPMPVSGRAFRLARVSNYVFLFDRFCAIVCCMKTDGRRPSQGKLQEIRFAAVKAAQAGQAAAAAAREMGLYGNRVLVWLAAYRAGGWDALRAHRAGGGAQRMSGSQMQWIYNAVTSKNPTPP